MHGDLLPLRDEAVRGLERQDVVLSVVVPIYNEADGIAS